MCMYVTSWPFVTLPDCWALHLASTWPYLRCDVGLEEGKHWEKKSCLCLSIVYHYNGAQWYKQFLQVGRLDTVDNAWFNSSVSSVFMVFTIVPFFTLLIGELSLMGLALDLVEQPLSFSAVTLLVGSSDSQNRPQNDLQCVEWDVKTLLYHIIPDCWAVNTDCCFNVCDSAI